MVIQDVVLTQRNTRFLLERYYSPSSGESIDAELPEGYRGSELGPHLLAFVFMLYFQARVTQNKIEEILHGMGVLITDSEISRILLRPKPELEKEEEQTRLAAIRKCGFVHADDTGARILDHPAYTVVTCNPYFCHYLTTENKNRLSVLEALNGKLGIHYLINRTSLSLLKGRIAQRHLRELRRMVSPVCLDSRAYELKILRLEKLSKSSREEITVACAIAAYRSQGDLTPGAIVTDDATNYKNLLRRQQLCWVHEIRHYKELLAFGAYQERLVRDQIERMRALYKLMKTYKIRPGPELHKKIEEEFDAIFLRTTPMNALNEQLALTHKRKQGLLQVLKDPFLPLENNEAERDVRERVLKRKISYGNRSWAGVRAWDLQLGLLHTCRKLGVSYWEFLKDRFESRGEIPSLHRIVQAAA